MVERLLIVAALAAVVTIAYYVFRAYHVRSMETGSARTTGHPTLLYFRADSCAVCPTQGRIVDQLVEQWEGRLHVERIDAEREPDTAARYRVFSLPTTILLDADGHVRQVNYGLADLPKLNRQLASLEMTGSESVPVRLGPATESVPTD